MDDTTRINEEAARLAIACYQFAKKQGCDESLAMSLAHTAHQHWLFALSQQTELQMASLLAEGGKLS